jgi:hypothetical protein
MPFRGEQSELRFGARDAQCNPALRSEGLVRHYAEVEFFGCRTSKPGPDRELHSAGFEITGSRAAPALFFVKK